MKYLLALISIEVSAQAADITITVTDLQVKAVTRVVARMNMEKVNALVAGETGTLTTNVLKVTFTPENGEPRTATLVTPLQYGKFLCDAALDSIVQQERILVKQEIAEKYDAAPDNTKTEVEAALTK